MSLGRLMPESVRQTVKRKMAIDHRFDAIGVDRGNHIALIGSTPDSDSRHHKILLKKQSRRDLS